MRIGYARVSTADQNPDLQEDALQKARCEKTFRDVAIDSRRGLAEAIDYARDGDTLWKLDQLGRSLKHLIEIVNGLAARRVGFQSLRESMDTTTSGGKLISHVFGALAEFERELIRERTQAGLRHACIGSIRPVHTKGDQLDRAGCAARAGWAARPRYRSSDKRALHGHRRLHRSGVRNLPHARVRFAPRIRDLGDHKIYPAAKPAK